MILSSFLLPSFFLPSSFSFIPLSPSPRRWRYFVLWLCLVANCTAESTYAPLRCPSLIIQHVHAASLTAKRLVSDSDRRGYWSIGASADPTHLGGSITIVVEMDLQSWLLG